jgi:predicted nucleic acid-binding protein
MAALLEKLAERRTFSAITDPVRWQRELRAVALGQQRKMSLGAALVAGTALAHGLTLVARDIGDVQWIQGLSRLNPCELEPPQEHEPQR